MGFGNGYVPRESEKLEPGEYEARILGARPEQTKNGTPYLAVYVQVKGHPHCRPNSMTFYDRPYVGEKEQVRWDEKMTEFLDAFHMPRDTPLGGPYESWKGAVGWVRCVPQKSAPEYSNLYPLKKGPQGQAPAQPAAGQAAAGGYVPPAAQQGQGGDAFPEDVPF